MIPYFSSGSSFGINEFRLTRVILTDSFWGLNLAHQVSRGTAFGSSILQSFISYLSFMSSIKVPSLSSSLYVALLRAGPVSSLPSPKIH